MFVLVKNKKLISKMERDGTKYVQFCSLFELREKKKEMKKYN